MQLRLELDVATTSLAEQKASGEMERQLHIDQMQRLQEDHKVNKHLLLCVLDVIQRTRIYMYASR